MATQTAKNAALKVNKEFFSLEPSSIISLFEVDLTNISLSNDPDNGLSQFIINLKNVQLVLANSSGGIFNYKTIRLHNNLKLNTNVIYWKGNAYFPAPISTQGFEVASKGLFPKPRVEISFSEEALDIYSLFKGTIDFGELIGAKFTRIRTFAKFLDRQNFYQQDGSSALSTDKLVIPEGFEPDPNCEFPRDIYYFDRKSSENKNSIQFELSSAIDLDRVKLPKRRVLSYICPWQYRGEGCLYEYQTKLNSDIHGTTVPIPNKKDPTGNTAPACATEDDQAFSEMSIFSNTTISNNPSIWKLEQTYSKGAVVYIVKQNINFYFIAKTDVPKNSPPPNGNFWIPDQCSKTIKGCKIRFGDNALPFGGFYGVSNYNRGVM
jgi:lambda family phage minor tail protein L